MRAEELSTVMHQLMKYALERGGRIHIHEDVVGEVAKREYIIATDSCPQLPVEKTKEEGE